MVKVKLLLTSLLFNVYYLKIAGNIASEYMDHHTMVFILDGTVCQGSSDPT